MAEFTPGVTHWDPEECFGCRIKTATFAPSIFQTTPGGRKAASNNAQEAQLSRDLASFKRMRLAGEHPRSTRGAERVESQAESSFEIESGQFAHKMAKGKDAGKPISKRGSEWRKRAADIHESIKKGQTVDAS